MTKKLDRKWKVFIIHHSHTDIGYTERQERVTAYHVDYIKQIIDILDEAYKKDKADWKGFKWVCEGMWSVEKFLEEADDYYKESFEKYVKAGYIGLSGSYLNMTEMIDGEVMGSMINRAKVYGEKIGVNVNSSMTADINGYSFGYADNLYDNGVENIISFIHTHHGHYPLWKKQTPFWWESPKGNKVFAWVGEHYNLGNALGLTPAVESNLLPVLTGKELEENREEYLFKLKENIFDYLRSLQDDGYAYTMVPIAISGVLTDNSPPNVKIIETINWWNENFRDEVEICMSTLDEFFKVARKECVDIPTYKGDWTDWWADGVSSTPLAVKTFRDAQRKYKLCKRLDRENNIISKDLKDEIEYDLTMYAEHTWGYHTSISEPWDRMVNDLDLRKTHYAIKAHQNVFKGIDKVLKYKGEILNKINSNPVFKVVNPYDFHVKDIAKLHLYNWENPDDIVVIDESTGKIVEHQTERCSRGTEVNVVLELNGREEKVLVVKNKDNVKGELSEGDDFKNEKIKASLYKLENSFFEIKYEEEEGIISIFDKKNNKELLRKDRLYNAFTPIYEITPIENNVCYTRGIMYKNRKSISTRRYNGVLRNVKVKLEGNLFTRVELNYEIKGSSDFSILLTIYRDIPKIDVAVRMNKENKWEPENMYIALPFTTGDSEEELWIEKSGAILRPGIDQLPGSLTDFYSIQEGVAYVSSNSSLAIAIQDTPLIHLGSLKNHDIKLHDENNYEHNKEQLYSWVMNNFWETNFKASLGGFYEFNYYLYISPNIKDEKNAIEMNGALNQGIIGFRISNKSTS